MEILRYIRFLIFFYYFRYKNRHNNVNVTKYYKFENVKIGRATYGNLNIIGNAPIDTKIYIGNYCSIGPNVTFLVGGEHNYKRISTYPFQTLCYHQPTLKKINRDIIVEDDVWIGYDSLIMSGVRIGRGAVIGARSIVTKDVPPYSVYVGNHVIKKRFSDEIIEKLMCIDYSKITHTQGDSYEEFCQSEITEQNIMKILNKFNKKIAYVNF